MIGQLSGALVALILIGVTSAVFFFLLVVLPVKLIAARSQSSREVKEKERALCEGDPDQTWDDLPELEREELFPFGSEAERDLYEAREQQKSVWRFALVLVFAMLYGIWKGVNDKPEPPSWTDPVWDDGEVSEPCPSQFDCLEPSQ